MAAERAQGKPVRCAIYTRKSSEDGLEQAFNSLDAQREACAAYIVSQRHAGWTAVAGLYDDGGLSGGTLERPALQRLLADIRGGRVDIVVVYKVDRLTRSLADFARIVDILDASHASFVSVTQQFNTTTSMGRLTLNMLLSFAQFEREIAGERIRDKIAASKAKGMWMGGTVPLGYEVRDRKLVVDEAGAATVRLVFQRYAALGSVHLLGAELDRLGIVSGQRRSASGRVTGGGRLSRGALYTLLQNRTYRGEVAHKGNVYKGQHERIVDDDLWRQVEARLAANRQDRALSIGAEAPSLLAGLISDTGGQRLTPTHANKKGRRYRYYIATALLTGKETPRPGGVRRIPAGEIERVVLDRLGLFLATPVDMADTLGGLMLDAATLERAMERARALAVRWQSDLPPVERHRLARLMLTGVRVGPAEVEIGVAPIGLAEALGIAAERAPGHVADRLLTVEAALQRAGKGKRIVIAGTGAAAIDAGLVRLVRHAFAARELLLAEGHDSINAITARVGKSKGLLTSLARLSWLSPRIVGDLLAGRQPVGLTPKTLLGLSKDLPHDWTAQRPFLGFID